MAITQETLKGLLTYNPETGVFLWNTSKKKAGSENHRGYIQIGIDGKLYYAHRLAFLYMTGAMPFGIVDHRNRKKADNHWANLRDTTQAENNANKEGVTLLNGIALKRACKLAGVSYTTVRERIQRHGCTAEEAIQIAPLKIGGNAQESFAVALAEFRARNI